MGDVGEYLNLVQAVTQEADDFKNLVKEVVNLIKSCSSEFSEIPDMMVDWMVKTRIRSIKMYEEAGFSRDEAITLSIYDSEQLQKSVKNK